MFTSAQQTAFRLINREASSRSLQIFVVGGVVRDLLLGAPAKDLDLDFMIEGNAIEEAQKLVAATGGELKKFPSFFTAKIIEPSAVPGVAELDFASAREETYSQPGSLPTVTLSTCERDLSRRDFSINAMALRVSDLVKLLDQPLLDQNILRTTIIDRHRGLADLDSRLIRVLHDNSFRDDPTRLFRAVRYGVRIGGGLDTSTAQLFAQALQEGAVEQISAQRIFNELKKILEEEKFIECFQSMQRLGLLARIGPTIGAAPEVILSRVGTWAQRLGTLNYAERGLFFIALFLSRSNADDWSERWISLGLGRKRIEAIARCVRGADSRHDKASSVHFSPDLTQMLENLDTES